VIDNEKLYQSAAKIRTAVILVAPMCLLPSIFGARWAGMNINIFTQIGFAVAFVRSVASTRMPTVCDFSLPS